MNSVANFFSFYWESEGLRCVTERCSRDDEQQRRACRYLRVRAAAAWWVEVDFCVYFRAQLISKRAASSCFFFSCTPPPSEITEKPGEPFSKVLSRQFGAEETDLIGAAIRNLT